MDDSINRQAALNATHDVILSFIDFDDEERPITSEDKILLEVNKAITTRIKALPTADVAPVRRGRWEERQVMDEKSIEVWQSARCSVCGKYHTNPYLYYFDDYAFCPHCGATMDSSS